MTPPTSPPPGFVSEADDLSPDGPTPPAARAALASVAASLGLTEDDLASALGDDPSAGS